VGNFFKKIGHAISKFTKNLLKDPLNTIMTVISAVMAFYTFGATAFASSLWNIGRAGWVIVGVTLAVVAVGTDSRLLMTALAVFAFVMTAYEFGPGYNPKEGILAAFGYTKPIDPVWRLLRVAVSAFLTMATFTSLRDGLTFGEGIETAAGEIASVIGGTAGSIVSGFASGLLSSPMGWVILLGGLYLLTTESTGTVISVGSNQKETEHV
jgi:hypothetical protein